MSRPLDGRLGRASVGIAGLGGLGSTVAVALARAGVGHLVLADYDIVEQANLDRQQYLLEHVGMPKTQAMTRILARIDPAIGLSCRQVKLDRANIPEVFRGTDVIAECLDGPDQKQMLVETVLACMGQPIVTASGLAGYGRSNQIRTRRISQRLVVVGDGCSDAYAGMPLCSPRVWIAAAHQANAVICLLLGQEV